jgi:hypothetical protein
MNAGAHFRIRYEGEPRAIGGTLESDVSAFAPKLLVDYSIFHPADAGHSFVIVWQSIY